MTTAFIAVILAVFLAACKAKSFGPGDEFTFKKSGRIDGVTQVDYDRVFDVSLLPSTKVTVQINGQRFLNIYEFSQKQEHYVKFGKKVTINPDGTVTFRVPDEPAAPTGTAYTVFYDN